MLHDGAEIAEIAEDRLATAVTLMRGWIWETDAEHRFTYMSESVELFSGKRPEWHYGKTREQIGSVDPRQPQWVAYYDCIAARKPFGPVEFLREQCGANFHMRTLGSPRFDPSGKFLGYRGIAFDITSEIAERDAKKVAQNAIHISATILTAALHNLPIGVCIFDADLRLVFANEQYYEMFTLPRSHFALGCHANEITDFLKQRGEFLNYTGGEAVSAYNEIVRGGRHYSYERTRPDGSRLEVLGASLPSGGYIKTFRDISERQEKEWRQEGRIVNLTAKIRMLEEILGI